MNVKHRSGVEVADATRNVLTYRVASNVLKRNEIHLCKLNAKWQPSFYTAMHHRLHNIYMYFSIFNQILPVSLLHYHAIRDINNIWTNALVCIPIRVQFNWNIRKNPIYNIKAQYKTIYETHLFVYSLFHPKQRADIDECATDKFACDSTQVCENTPGSYQCECRSGFSMDNVVNACVGKWFGRKTDYVLL